MDISLSFFSLKKIKAFHNLKFRSMECTISIRRACSLYGLVSERDIGGDILGEEININWYLSEIFDEKKYTVHL